MEHEKAKTKWGRLIISSKERLKRLTDSAIFLSGISETGLTTAPSLKGATDILTWNREIHST